MYILSETVHKKWLMFLAVGPAIRTFTETTDPLQGPYCIKTQSQSLNKLLYLLLLKGHGNEADFLVFFAEIGSS
jgi:hypothetical protein